MINEPVKPELPYCTVEQSRTTCVYHFSEGIIGHECITCSQVKFCEPIHHCKVGGVLHELPLGSGHGLILEKIAEALVQIAVESIASVVGAFPDNGLDRFFF